MAEAQLLAELEESKAEIQRLKESLSGGTPTVHKDLSSVSLIPKWSGLDSGVPIEEFLTSIEGVSYIGKWEESDQIRIAVLKLSDAARLFYNGCPELHEKNVTWQMFNNVFSQRFKDTHTDQHNFMRLQTARQKKNESPQQFADRCRALSQKIMCKTSDPVAQSIHRENAELMLLASFVSGLVCRTARYWTGPIYRSSGSRKPKNKFGLMKVFMRNLIIRLDCQRGHPVGPARMTISLSAHLTRQRSITCVVSATNLRTALASQQPQLPGMHRRKLKSGVMSANGYDTSLESALPDEGKPKILRTHVGKRNRTNFGSVRVSQKISHLK